MNNIKFSPDELVKIIDLMGKGYSLVQVAANLGISKNKLEKLAERPENEDLREAIELGQTNFEAYMEKVGQTNLNERTFKDSVWKSFMSKYFDWNEKQNINVKTDQKRILNLDEKDLDEEIRQLAETCLIAESQNKKNR